MDTFDLIVIGSGPGGYTAAIRAAQLGMRTAIVEEDRLGGVCLNWGCIPTKAILHSAEQFEEIKGGKIPGVKVEGLRADYGAVIDASRKAADRLNKGVTGLMRKNKVEVVAGRGRLTGRGRVTVAGKDATRELSAPNVLLATGSTELVFPGIEVDGERVLTSREALESRKLPASIVVVGGGAVGLEFAYAYQAYGAEVTVIEMAPQVLPGFDSEVAEVLASAFGRRKVKIRTKTAYRGLEVDGDGVNVTVEGEKGEETLRAEQILFGVGRRALSADVGLETLGVAVDRGFVKTGDDYRTSVDGVWAIGDVRGGAMLAHKAAEEGVAAVEYMAGHRKLPLNYAHIPACVYCQPQVAGVGMSEAQAREAGHDVKIGKFPFVAAGKAVGTGHTEGFVKMVTDAKYGEILGAQIIGAGATELIAEIATAMAAESTVHEIAEATHAHPTLAEAVKEAALSALGRSLNI
jgi:dihydrolipoamide dehydrogenase